MAKQPPERASLRREGRELRTTLVCCCKKSRTFAVRYDEHDVSPNALFKPIDKLNKTIKAASWIEDTAGTHDWCPRCARYRVASRRWKGGRRYKHP